MINAVHTLVYADDADAARAFFRDVLGWRHVDVHDGWLIFKTGPSELGVHPNSGAPDSDAPDSGAQNSGVQNSGAGVEPALARPRHEISLLCDDIEQTVTELRAKGAQFTSAITDQRWGRTTMLAIPGAGEMMIYEPRHPLALDL